MKLFITIECNEMKQLELLIRAKCTFRETVMQI